MTERPKSSHEPAAPRSRSSSLSKTTHRCAERSPIFFNRWGLKLSYSARRRKCWKTSFPDVASCLVLDVRLPGLSGLDFQTELAKAKIHIPIIFMTGHGDIPMTVRAMKGGAVDFLTKPFRDQDMLDAVLAAIEQDRKRRESDKKIADLQALLETLTPREREILLNGIIWPHEQTDSSRTWSCRDYGEDPSWAYHEENGCEVVGSIW